MKELIFDAKLLLQVMAKNYVFFKTTVSLCNMGHHENSLNYVSTKAACFNTVIHIHQVNRQPDPNICVCGNNSMPYVDDYN